MKKKKNSYGSKPENRSRKKADARKKANARRENQELLRLRRDLEQEKKQNALLRRQLASLRQKQEFGRAGKSDPKEKNLPRDRSGEHTLTEEREKIFHDTAGAAPNYAKRTYFGYLIHSLTGSRLYRWFETVMTYMRRLRVVRIVATFSTVIFTTALLSAFFLTAIPVLIVVTAVFMLIAGIRSHRMNRNLSERLSHRHIRVIVPESDMNLSENSFLARQAAAMAAESNTAVIVVSPHTWSPKGLGGHGLFFTAREENHHLYLVRKYYYFILRRRVLDVLDEHMSILYI